MHGDDDQVVPIADSAELSIKLLKDGTLKVYPGFPHGMCTDTRRRHQRGPARLHPGLNRGTPEGSVDESDVELDDLFRNGTPGTIAGWKALADGLLTTQSCAFHRNVEISARYAWIYSSCPRASSGPGWPRSPRTTSGWRSIRSGWTRTDGATGHPAQPGAASAIPADADVNTIRETNNAIFDDIFWVHLAYVTADDGMARLRGLLQAEAGYASVLAGFDAIDRGRRVLADETASRGGSAAGRRPHLGGQRRAPRP